MSQIGSEATFDYAVFVTGFKVKQPPLKRKSKDFLHINGKGSNFDKLEAKEKDHYIKNFLKKI